MAPSPAATVVDAAAFADAATRARVVAADRLAEVLAEFPGGGAADLADFLVARRTLTRFQADRVLAGDTARLAPGPYRLTGVHRAGALGPVYRAVHTSKPGAFAVRLLPLRSLWQARQAKRLPRSFGRVGSHPRVVPLVDADSAKGFHYLVWPLADDELLADRVVREGPLAPHAVAGVLADAAEGLAAVHARQLAHGLLTPRAIGLTPDGRARLLDFGAGLVLAANLAADESLFDTLSTSQAVVGMLDFAAPEVLADPATLTPAADLYALGVVGYVAATGRLPFPDARPADRLLARQALDAPKVREVNPGVPAELGRVIDRLMAADPAGRFAADELHEVLLLVADELDPARPVLVPPGGFAAAAGEASGGGTAGGAISWASTESGVVRPPERDDSDASVTFDMPADQPPPDDANVAASQLAAVDTPRGEHTETPASTRSRRPSLMLEAGLTPPPSASPPVPEVPPETPPDPARPNPPKLTLPTPVQWHTGDATAPDAAAGGTEQAPADSILWKKMKRNLLFWQAARDVLQVSVFGPPAVTPGQTIKLSVYLHQPEAAESVRTLARAFQHDAELIGTGGVAREVPRESELAVHLSATNAAAAKSLVQVVWHGQPRPVLYDLHVPWESPAGPAPGLVSVGLENVRVGKAPFTLHILPRKG